MNGLLSDNVLVLLEPSANICEGSVSLVCGVTGASASAPSLSFVTHAAFERTESRPCKIDQHAESLIWKGKEPTCDNGCENALMSLSLKNASTASASLALERVEKLV